MCRRIISLLLLCALVVTGMAGCTEPPVNTEPSSTAPPATEPSAAELYEQARQAIDGASNLKLLLTTNRVMTAGAESFTSYIKQDISMSGIGTKELQVKLTEETDLNDQFIRISEYYVDDIMYTTIDGSLNFKGALSQSEYLARFAPAVLLDASLYGQITSTEEAGGTRITFSSPSAAESWAMPEDAHLVSASGSALISAEGVLEETVYSIVYDYGAAHVELTVTAVPQARKSITIVGVSSSIKYQELADIAVPRLHAMAQMYLYATKSVSSTITETVLCEAVNFAYTQQIGIDLYGQNEDFKAHVAYNVATFQDNESQAFTMEDHYEDGSYVFTDVDQTTDTTSYPSDYVIPYFQGYLMENIPQLDDTTSIDMVEIGGIIYLEMKCNEEYSNGMNNYACDTIFGDAGFLNANASDYETVECMTYLAIDSYTGFPTATGIYYNGIHTINGYEYNLILQTDQSFYVGSMQAYEQITGESLPVEEPEIAPAPLFYHVTGQEGQEMWLLGTIHVGDARTACLPQEIYDALEGSDALAVEFDVSAFEEAIAADETLAEDILSAYLYEDGSLTADHLDEPTYAAAMMMLRSSGGYNNTLQYMKPVVWSQVIEGLFLQQSYTKLSSDMGVDLQLLEKAKELDKEILDIESGVSQIQMLFGYSDELQQVLLQSTLSTSIAQYRTELLEMFEQWCAGDEAALRETINREVDISELTEEELAVYEAQKSLIEEYDKAMNFDRNEDMLKKAVEYLESGDVIFYAVGIAHLLDDTNGLVDALREAGYTVELVTYQ